MNFLVAWMLISISYAYGVPTAVSEAEAVQNPYGIELLVSGITNDSPAEKAGLKPGDRIVSISDTDNKIVNPKGSDVQNLVANSLGKQVNLEYIRGSEPATTTALNPVLGIVEGKAAIGISMDMVQIRKFGIIQSIGEGFLTTKEITIATVQSFYKLVRDIFLGKAQLNEVTGPIGIIGLVSDTMGFGFIYLLGLVAIISINLAVLNFIPFPALDGGRLLFIIIEAIKRSPINPKVVNALNTTGFVLLIVLMIAITWHDIARILFG
jgi:regulator of sigma E protease